jgi:hypothetical protein
MNAFPPRLWRSAFAALALLTYAALAADSGKKSFDIPSGPAEKALRVFTEQCGLQVGFPTAIAAGVRTNSVQGEFTPEEAAARLLEGTSLKLVRDERSGAYSVVRNAPPEKNGRGAERAAAISPSAPAVSASAAATALRQEEAVVLSPFTVSEGLDRGYAATSTLAGTRLRTELKDTPVALTVLTKDFLDDVAATGADGVAAFVPSTEVMTVIGGDEAGRSNKGGNSFQMRGFSTSTRTRNFFQSSGSNDRYLTDRLTFTRGPNALVFGIGNPGGAVHLSTNRAHFRGNPGEIEFYYESYDGKRTSLDQNVELIKDRLAVRGDFLWTDTERFQWPSAEKKKGAFLTATWNPFHRDGRTQVRLNYEYDDTFRVAPPPYAPYDFFSSWEAAGAPLYDNRTSARPGTVPSATNPYVLQEGKFFDIRGQSSIPIFYTPRTTGYNSYLRSAGPIINGTEAQYSSIVTDFVSLNPLDLLRKKLGGEAALENWLAGLGSARSIPEMWRGGKTAIVPMDAWIGGEYDFYQRRFNAASLFLEQKIGRNLFIEIAGNIEDSKARTFEPMRYQDIAIAYDPNLYLPGGVPNPYAGMPYVGNMGSYASDAISHNRDYEYRAMVSYTLDLKAHRLARFFDLGRHQLAGLYNVLGQDEWYNRQSMAVVTKWDGRWVDQNSPLGTAFQTLGVQQGSLRLASRQYLLPGKAPYVTEPFFPINGDPGKVAADWVNYGAKSSGNISRATAVSTQSSLLDDRLVLTAGLRRDAQHSRQNVAYRFDATQADPLKGDYYGEIDAKRSLEAKVWLPEKAWVNRSMGAVGHLLRHWRAFDYAAVFYNRSTSVSGAQERYDIKYQPVSPLDGLGVDYGMRFSAFGGRLIGSFTRFETTQTNNFANSLFRFGRLGFIDYYKVLEIVEPTSEILVRRSNTALQWTPIFDSVTKGNEIELTWNATNNLRLRGTYSNHENIYSRFGDDLSAFVAEHRPLWEKFIQANYDPNFKGAVNPARPTAAEQLKIDADYVRQQLAIMEAEVPLKQALNGVPSTGVPYSQASLAMNYTLPGGGWWRGLSAGTNVRYRGRAPLAFKTDANGTVDRSVAFEAEAMTKVDFNLAYRRRLLNGRITWRIQGTVRNAFNDRDPLLLSADWDVTTSRFLVRRNQIMEPRSYILTSSFGW